MTALPPLSWESEAQRQRYAAGLAAVEGRLVAVAEAASGVVATAAAATLTAGGKRLRPLLTLLCARRDRPLGDDVLAAAAAVELLHMATLVHDDVLDHAALRRGRPTVAAEHGPETAVSVGNFLLASAFSTLARVGDPDAVSLLSATAVALSEGEVLQRAAAHDAGLTFAEYERRCERKTADLFAAACRLGAMLSGNEEAAAPLSEFGRLLGLAFQVFDDILDVEGDEALTGKQAGTDVRDGTITLPLIFALEERPDLRSRLATPRPDPATVAAVLAAVTASDALRRAREVAMGYIGAAQAHLAACPEGVERDLLSQVALEVVRRYS